MSRVAALYVETGGVYFGLEDVDPWDEARDARLYAGPWPVVAHPPCNTFSLAAAISGRRGSDDGGCFEAALAAVHRFGGVLEQPAHSLAWRQYGLPRPMRAGGWSATLDGHGWACWVDQGWYGHPFKKPTWLYAYGSNLPALRWGVGPGATLPHRNVRGGSGLDNLSAHGRKRLLIPTPPLFRDALLAMAHTKPPHLL
jgi:hypothetical protein